MDIKMALVGLWDPTESGKNNNWKNNWPHYFYISVLSLSPFHLTCIHRSYSWRFFSFFLFSNYLFTAKTSLSHLLLFFFIFFFGYIDHDKLHRQLERKRDRLIHQGIFGSKLKVAKPAGKRSRLMTASKTLALAERNGGFGSSFQPQTN